jgi:light-regulated signal transduction histidine kinase (bacteriophytochrome)
MQNLNNSAAHQARQLEALQKEMESFSYSISHDLRAPLRVIDGFSLALQEDYEEKLDTEGQKYIHYIRDSVTYMRQLIDDLLYLSRVTRGDAQIEQVNLSDLAQMISAELQQSAPHRHVEWVIADGLIARGDTRLLWVALEHLLDNAWKFTAPRVDACIEFGRTHVDGAPAYVVRDNGVGFDMVYIEGLFRPFQRLHTSNEFPGRGIGLATVQRIVHRHGGRIWAEGAEGAGAAFYFTLP